MDWTQILLWLTPFIVWAATALVKFIKPLLPGWVLVSVVVPLISMILTALGTLVIPNEKPWLQFAIGLLAVFLSQLKIQLSPEKRAEDNKLGQDKVG